MNEHLRKQQDAYEELCRELDSLRVVSASRKENEQRESVNESLLASAESKAEMLRVELVRFLECLATGRRQLYADTI